MTRVQSQVAILIALAVVMIAVYARALRPAAGPKTTQLASPAPSSEPSVQQPNTVLSLSSGSRDAQRQRLAELKSTRDPFTPGAGSGQTSGLALSGILWDASRPIAIINGTMVQVGQEVEGYRVVEIAQDHVSVSDGVETFRLPIAP